jgi:hypothetical protein
MPRAGNRTIFYMASTKGSSHVWAKIIDCKVFSLLMIDPHILFFDFDGMNLAFGKFADFAHLVKFRHN